MSRSSVVILTVFLLALAVSARADNGKIDLGTGRTQALAESGERVRVNVAFRVNGMSAARTQVQLRKEQQTISSAREAILQRHFSTGLARVSDLSDDKQNPKGPVLLRKLDNAPGMTLSLTRSEMETLAKDPEVVSITEDRLMKPALFTDTVALIGAPAVWNTGHSGGGYSVAILDTGVDFEHQSTQGKIVGSACFSTNDASQNATSFCPNGQETQIGGNAGNTCPPVELVHDQSLPEPAEEYAGCDHGTVMAGIAAGAQITDSLFGQTIEGVAPSADIVAVQVASLIQDPLACDGNQNCVRIFESDLQAGIDYVISNARSLNVAAANLSITSDFRRGVYCDTSENTYYRLLGNLRDLNVAPVVAAGNDSYTDGVSTPGCASTAITVGATSSDDILYSYSNSAEMVDLLAPGLALAPYPTTPSMGNHYAQLASGTSVAAAHVSGAFALLRSAHPSATVDEIEDALKTSGKLIVDARNGVAKPRIRLDLANQLLDAGGAGLGQISLTPLDGFFGTGTLTNLSSFTTQTYTLRNESSTTLDWSVSANRDWIAFDQASGSLPPGVYTTVTVSVDTDKVTSGQEDSGTITFISGDDVSIRAAALFVRSPILNDNFADALPASGIVSVFTSTNANASREPGEPKHGGTANEGGSSVWYKWTAPVTLLMNADTANSEFDPMMGVYTGDAVNALTILDQNDDYIDILTSEAGVSWAAEKGKEYYIAVDGYDGSSGRFTLQIYPKAAPANDMFAGRQEITGTEGLEIGENVQATAQDGEPTIGTHLPLKTIWYSWTAPESGDYRFSTEGSSFNTVMGIYTGSSLFALTEVASNDDADGYTTSAVTFTATAGTTYSIVVDGKTVDFFGRVNLSWNKVGQGPNMLTAVLPTDRSVKVGEVATAFLTAINAGNETARNCGIATTYPGGAFGISYQTTDATNATTGSPNTPVDIPAGSAQSYVFAITPTVEMDGQQFGPRIVCENAPASHLYLDLNTFTLSANLVKPADMLTLVDTLTHDGVVELPGVDGTGFAVMATSAIGESAELTLSATPSDGLPVEATVCETDPVTGVCAALPSASLHFLSLPGETRTFAIFIKGAGNIPFDPGNSRVLINFRDNGGVSRGGASVAVKTTTQ